jgi:hypothetical protein
MVMSIPSTKEIIFTGKMITFALMARATMFLGVVVFVATSG